MSQSQPQSQYYISQITKSESSLFRYIKNFCKVLRYYIPFVPQETLQINFETIEMLEPKPYDTEEIARQRSLIKTDTFSYYGLGTILLKSSPHFYAGLMVRSIISVVVLWTGPLREYWIRHPYGRIDDMLAMFIIFTAYNYCNFCTTSFGQKFAHATKLQIIQQHDEKYVLVPKFQNTYGNNIQRGISTNENNIQQGSSTCGNNIQQIYPTVYSSAPNVQTNAADEYIFSPIVNHAGGFKY